MNNNKQIYVHSNTKVSKHKIRCSHNTAILYEEYIINNILNPETNNIYSHIQVMCYICEGVTYLVNSKNAVLVGTIRECNLQKDQYKSRMELDLSVKMAWGSEV